MVCLGWDNRQGGHQGLTSVLLPHDFRASSPCSTSSQSLGPSVPQHLSCNNSICELTWCRPSNMYRWRECWDTYVLLHSVPEVSDAIITGLSVLLHCPIHYLFADICNVSLHDEGSDSSSDFNNEYNPNQDSKLQRRDLTCQNADDGTAQWPQQL